MIFSEYITLLYAAFLEDKGYIETLRNKIKSEEFNRSQMYDPVFHDITSIDPRRLDTFRHKRAKFFPNPFNPESGVYTYENKQNNRETLRIIRECHQRRRDRDNHQESKN
jgi:hypothetical protein